MKKKKYSKNKDILNSDYIHLIVNHSYNYIYIATLIHNWYSDNWDLLKDAKQIFKNAIFIRIDLIIIKSVFQ